MQKAQLQTDVKSKPYDEQQPRKPRKTQGNQTNCQAVATLLDHRRCKFGCRDPASEGAGILPVIEEALNAIAKGRKRKALDAKAKGR